MTSWLGGCGKGDRVKLVLEIERSQKARRVQILGGGFSCRQSTDVVNCFRRITFRVNCPHLRPGKCRQKGSARVE